uniref:Uncharacterized protein n=1 Tax=Anguilla anguilla TaxID=7936 RepID=A0A0E9T9I3_ANGAN
MRVLVSNLKDEGDLNRIFSSSVSGCIPGYLLQTLCYLISG